MHEIALGNKRQDDKLDLVITIKKFKPSCNLELSFSEPQMWQNVLKKNQQGEAKCFESQGLVCRREKKGYYRSPRRGGKKWRPRGKSIFTSDCSQASFELPSLQQTAWLYMKKCNLFQGNAHL